MVLISSILFGILAEKIWQPWSLFIRLLLNQGSDEVTYLRWNFKINNLLNKLSLVILIIIWSQSASILTKAFTGNLLNTYFNPKFQPIVETLEDIYQKKQIKIASDTNNTRKFLEKQSDSTDLIDNICDRVNHFIKKYEYNPFNFDFVNEILASKMIKGEIVILLNTNKCQFFVEYFSRENLNFQISDKKYGPNRFNYMILRTHPAAKIVEKL